MDRLLAQRDDWMRAVGAQRRAMTRRASRFLEDLAAALYRRVREIATRRNAERTHVGGDQFEVLVIELGGRARATVLRRSAVGEREDGGRHAHVVRERA